MLSRILRRIHLYLALFLGPWILMYAISTMVMNHREWFRGRPPAPPVWEPVSSGIYDGVFPQSATAQQMAAQILAGLGMDGAHQATLRDGKLVILRNEPARPVRISYSTADRRLTVERQAPDSAAFLERMHRRRGFQHPYLLEDAWAFSVDFFIASMLFWVLSGLWMWYEMKATHRWGLVSLSAGLSLFAVLAAVL